MIRLEGTVLAWEEFQRSSYCFTQNGGVPGESTDVQPARWLQMRGCVVLMDMNQYWDFPFHAAIKHYCILQRLQCLAGILFCQYICPHTTFPGSLIFSAQRFCTSSKDTCLDVSLTGTATTNSIYCCFSLFFG